MKYVKLFESFDGKEKDINSVIKYIISNIDSAVEANGMKKRSIEIYIDEILKITKWGLIDEPESQGIKNQIMSLYTKTEEYLYEMETYEEYLIELKDDGVNIEIKLNPLFISIKIENDMDKISHVISRLAALSKRFKNKINLQSSTIFKDDVVLIFREVTKKPTIEGNPGRELARQIWADLHNQDDEENEDIEDENELDEGEVENDDDDWENDYIPNRRRG